MKLFHGLLAASLLLAAQAFAAGKTFDAVAEEYPPFTDSRLPSQGWTWAVIKAALETRGYTPTLTLVPWARAVEESKSGRRDALVNAYWSEDRLASYLFSSPIGEVKSRFYRRADHPEYRFNGDLHSLGKLQIGVVRGYTISEAFDNADYLQKVPLTKTEQGLVMLQSGRIDLLASGDLGDGSNLLQALEKQFPGIQRNIVPVDPPLSRQFLHVAISKAAPGAARKLEDLNIGLYEIMLNGSYRKILKAHGVSVD